MIEVKLRQLSRDRVVDKGDFAADIDDEDALADILRRLAKQHKVPTSDAVLEAYERRSSTLRKIRI